MPTDPNVKVDIVGTNTLRGRAAEREARRQELMIKRQRVQRLNNVGTIGGWIVVLIIASGVAAVVSGVLWWLALYIWTNLPV